jgi:hypothetical protein
MAPLLLFNILDPTSRKPRSADQYVRRREQRRGFGTHALTPEMYIQLISNTLAFIYGGAFMGIICRLCDPQVARRAGSLVPPGPAVRAERRGALDRPRSLR